MNKIKSFFNCNGRYIFVFILVFMIYEFFGYGFTYGDPIANYGFSYAIKNGQIPYLEFNIISKIIEMYLQKQSLIELSKTSIIFLTFYISIGTLLQTFTYFCVNIKLENIFKYMRYYIVKTFKLESKSKPENIVIKDSIENLNLFSAFLASLLTTILFIIIFTILIIIGLTISKSLVI